MTNAAPARPAAVLAWIGDAPGRPVADILEIVERVLREQQQLVLRLEAIAHDPGEGAASERAAIRHHMACHAADIDRCMTELGTITPPEGPPLA